MAARFKPALAGAAAGLASIAAWNAWGSSTRTSPPPSEVAAAVHAPAPVVDAVHKLEEKVSPGHTAVAQHDAPPTAGPGADEEGQTVQVAEPALAPQADTGGAEPEDTQPERQVVHRNQPRPEHDYHEAAPDMLLVVNDSFRELVLESEGSVLIEAYQHGCRACEALGPRLRMLSSVVKKHMPGVQVAAIDTHYNWPLPKEIHGNVYPAIYLFPAGAKDKPVQVRMLESDNLPPDVDRADLPDDYGKYRSVPTVMELLGFLAKHAPEAAQSDGLREAAIQAEGEARLLNNWSSIVGFVDGLAMMIMDDMGKGEVPTTDAILTAMENLSASLKTAREFALHNTTFGSLAELDAKLADVEQCVVELATAADPASALVDRYIYTLGLMAQQLLPWDEPEEVDLHERTTMRFAEALAIRQQYIEQRAAEAAAAGDKRE